MYKMGSKSDKIIMKVAIFGFFLVIFSVDLSLYIVLNVLK